MVISSVFELCVNELLFKHVSLVKIQITNALALSQPLWGSEVCGPSVSRNTPIQIYIVLLNNCWQMSATVGVRRAVVVRMMMNIACSTVGVGEVPMEPR